MPEISTQTTRFHDPEPRVVAIKCSRASMEDIETETAELFDPVFESRESVVSPLLIAKLTEKVVMEPVEEEGETNKNENKKNKKENKKKEEEGGIEREEDTEREIETVRHSSFTLLSMHCFVLTQASLNASKLLFLDDIQSIT